MELTWKRYVLGFCSWNWQRIHFSCLYYTYYSFKPLQTVHPNLMTGCDLNSDRLYSYKSIVSFFLKQGTITHFHCPKTEYLQCYILLGVPFYAEPRSCKTCMQVSIEIRVPEVLFVAEQVLTWLFPMLGII